MGLLFLVYLKGLYQIQTARKMKSVRIPYVYKKFIFNSLRILRVKVIFLLV